MIFNRHRISCKCGFLDITFVLSLCHSRIHVSTVMSFCFCAFITFSSIFNNYNTCAVKLSSPDILKFFILRIHFMNSAYAGGM